MAASGMLLTSTETESPVKPMPYGATRLPLTSTSVRIEPRPCSEIAEMPPVVAPEADAAVSPFELDIEPTDCSNCSTLTAPVRWICSRVITCTGNAVSASIRLMEEPVISTRSSCCGATAGAGGAACWARAEEAHAPPNAMATREQSLVLVNVIASSESTSCRSIVARLRCDERLSSACVDFFQQRLPLDTSHAGRQSFRSCHRFGCRFVALRQNAGAQSRRRAQIPAPPRSRWRRPIVNETP